MKQRSRIMVVELFVIIILVSVVTTALIDMLAHGVHWLPLLIGGASLTTFIFLANRKMVNRSPERETFRKKLEELERKYPHCRISALPHGGWLLTNRETGVTEAIVSQ